MARVFIFLCAILLICGLSGCEQRQSSLQFSGYVEGKYTYFSANTPGVLQTIFVSKGDEVHEKQLLFRIQNPLIRYDVQAAKDRLSQAEEQKKHLQTLYDLQKSYVARLPVNEQAANQVKVEQIYGELANARNALTVFRTDLEKTEWVAKQSDIRSDKAGIVFDIYYETGEQVQAGIPILSLLEPNQTKMIFYIPETQLSNIHLDQEVYVSCDHCVQGIKGKITYISPKAEFAPPMLYSLEARQKLVYRVEAVPQPPLSLLHPGQPITVQLNNLISRKDKDG